jgi:hypothetical protein
MRTSITGFILRVLVPMGTAGFAGHFLVHGESRNLQMESTARMGRTASALLSGEMSLRTEALALDAPVIPQPDTTSPLMRAALAGDTLAALGTAPDGVTLSLALAEAAGDSTRIRASTVPFSIQSLGLFRTRTGRGVALYLRERKALSTPEDFGPRTLPNTGAAGTDTLPTLPQGSGIFPLSPTGTTPSPARLLVAPMVSQVSPLPLGRTGLIILGTWILGGLAWFLLLRSSPASPGALRLLPVTGIPLLALWLLLGFQAREVDREARALLRGDMVRILAILKDGGNFLPMETIPEVTDFQVFREKNGEILATTLPPGPLQAGLLRAPLPPPTHPALGRVDTGGSETLYAALLEAPEQGLFLTAPVDPRGTRRLHLLMALLGGLASLVAMTFLGHARK